jgi:phosphatidylserine/phosphatidylglycerophosphate/cardiolipin synthase-like enzyme
MSRQNVEISLCLADTGDDEGKAMLGKSLSGSRIHIGYSKKPYVHAKAGVVDGKYLFIGSMNFTSNALDHNREVGILFESSSGSSLVRESIQSDCGF